MMRKNGLTAVILLVALGLMISGKMVFAKGVTIQDLGTLGGTSSLASAVNDRGQVVGFTYLPNDTEVHAFSWTQAGGMVDLGTLGGYSSQAIAVNDSGQIVGWAFTADGTTHAFSWTQAGGMVNLGSLGGTYSGANAVNASGQIVGGASAADGASRAVLWQAPQSTN